LKFPGNLKSNFLEDFQSDYLVIGSGIAGLNFALRVAESGIVNLITKNSADSTNTACAQGGIAAVSGRDDSFKIHEEDTKIAGAGLCHGDAVETLVNEGPLRIDDLVRWGVDFTTEEDGTGFDLAREGGHSQQRIYHVRDYTGAEIQKVLLERVKQHDNIRIFENHYAIDLITEHHVLGNLQAAFNICFGAYVLARNDKTVKTFRSNYTMLATGGASSVYRYTTNPESATGDGTAMAYRAGVRIANMEFIQFHPTALYHQGTRMFLISEAMRGYGAKLINHAGEAFMENYDPRKELAPRDIVARAIDLEIKKSRKDFVYLDVTHKDPDDIRIRFPQIREHCKSILNLDITNTPIPVVPAAHYLCGGIMTSLNGQTSMQNLYAAGEVAHTGIHGANRLASNSLIEGMVFSHKAAMKVMSKTPRNFEQVEIPDWDETGAVNRDEWFIIRHNLRQIQNLMWDYVGIVRSKPTLKRAFRRVKLIYEENENYYKRTKLSSDLLELRNMSAVAYLIILSALRRNESRGCHYMSDFSEKDEKFLKDTII